jgi:ABC-2 type transport system ATP-binding protein
MKIEIRNLSVRYGQTTAIDDLSLTLEGEKIYGLLGRNAAGKTTLLSVLSAFRKASAGKVLIDGENPYENPRITREISFIRDRLDAPDTERVANVLRLAQALRPHWDTGYADKLVALFRLPVRKTVQALSRGQRSALGIVLGLASRSPLTILDESYLGLDAPSRYAFYDELLADYVAHPRTFIISTHLIEEVDSLFEEVAIMDRGRLVLHDSADALRAKGTVVTGPAEAVDRYVAGHTVLAERTLGPTKATTVLGPDLAPAPPTVETSPLSLQDLFVHLTREQEPVR